MINRACVFALGMVTLGVFDPASAQPAAQPSATPFAYEQPGMLPATLFFSADTITGKNYYLSPSVYNDGLYNTVTINSDYGVYSVTGDERVLNCLREIAAIAAIRSKSNILRFGEGIEDAGKGTLEAAQNIISQPIQTVQNIPVGAARFLGKIGQTIDHAATGNLDLPQGGQPGAVASQFLGVDKAKRILAAQLGVNPYSKNAALQSALNDAAWSLSLGKISAKIGTSVLLPFAASATISGINVTNSLTQQQVESSPSDLLQSVTTQLVEIGASSGNVEALLSNPEYDPWTLAAMANALVQVSAPQGTDAFVAKAATASTDVDAYYFYRAATLMAWYEGTSPITEIDTGLTAIVCRDQAGNIVVPLWADYIEWTPRLDQASARLASQVQQGQATGVVIVTTAQLSLPASMEMSSRNIQILRQNATPAVSVE